MEKNQYERIMDCIHEDVKKLKDDEVHRFLDPDHKFEERFQRHFPIGLANNLITRDDVESAGFEVDDMWDEDMRYLADMFRMKLSEKHSESEFLHLTHNQFFLVDSYCDIFADVLRTYKEHFYDNPALNPIHKNVEKTISNTKYDKICELNFRKIIMDKDFEWNQPNVESLLKLNDSLARLMTKARKQHNAIEGDISKLFAEGKKYYKDFYVETHIFYEFDNEKYDKFGFDCMNYLDEQLRLGWCAAPFTEELDELSWNIESLNHPSLKDHTICYLMHVIFEHCALPLQYGVQLNPDKFKISSEIQI